MLRVPTTSISLIRYMIFILLFFKLECSLGNSSYITSTKRKGLGIEDFSQRQTRHVYPEERRFAIPIPH